MSATSLQAQPVAVDTEIQEVLVSASLIPIAASRSGNAVTIIDREQLKTVQRLVSVTFFAMFQGSL